jgi:VWFA-related protein
VFFCGFIFFSAFHLHPDRIFAFPALHLFSHPKASYTQLSRLKNEKICRFCPAGDNLICLNFTVSFAQSRRVPPSSETGPQKANKREPSSKTTSQPEKNKASETDSETALTDENAVTDETDVIKIDTELVTIPVKVLDRNGRFLSGLQKENFQVFEDGKRQEIAHFSNEQQPFTVALVLDMSYSSTFKINEIQSAAIAFISQLRENDKIMVVSFDADVLILSEPTSDRQALIRAIKTTKVASGTSLYEAVDLIINEQLKRIKGRKAIVLFTDGVDTTSRRAHNLSNLRDALESDALIYPIQYDTFSDVQAMKNKPVIMQQPFPIPPTTRSPLPVPTIPTIGTPSSTGTSAEDYRRADEYLKEMANRTGGRVYEARTTANLALAFSKIAAELREFYSLGYYPNQETEMVKKRQIKVQVDQPKAVVHARDGYVVRKKDKRN